MEAVVGLRRKRRSTLALPCNTGPTSSFQIVRGCAQGHGTHDTHLDGRLGGEGVHLGVRLGGLGLHHSGEEVLR